MHNKVQQIEAYRACSQHGEQSPINFISKLIICKHSEAPSINEIPCRHPNKQKPFIMHEIASVCTRKMLPHVLRMAIKYAEIYESILAMWCDFWGWSFPCIFQARRDSLSTITETENICFRKLQLNEKSDLISERMHSWLDKRFEWLVDDAKKMPACFCYH